MSNWRERLNPRLRRALAILAEQTDGSMRKNDLWPQIVEEFPLDDQELSRTKTGTLRGENLFLWYSVDLVKAGWLFKSGDGLWRITDAGRAALETFPDSTAFADEARRLYADWSARRQKVSDGDLDVDLLSSQIVPLPGDELVRDLMRTMLSAGLATGDSHFRPGRPVWSASTADDLYQRYNLRPDLGSGSFTQKLQSQLADAPDDTILLAVELIAVSTVPLVNLGSGAKRERLNSLLSLLAEPVAVPPDVDVALHQGSWNGGVGMNVGAWKALAYLVELLRYWWTLPEKDRSEALADPWRCEEIVHAGPDLMPSQREALLYHLHPTSFLAIISVAHKKRIRDAFRSEGSEEEAQGLDRELFDITVSLQLESHEPISYYDPPLVHRWLSTASGTPTRRAWLIRGSAVNGQNLVPTWVGEGWTSLWLRSLDEIEPGASLTEIRAAVDNGYASRGVAYRRQKAEDAHEFLSLVQPGDLVLTTAEGQLYLGEVTGDATWSDNETLPARLRREVRWRNPDSPIAYEALPAPLPDRLASQEDVTDLTEDLDIIETLFDLGSGTTGREDAGEPVIEPLDLTLTPPTQELATSLLVPLDWLERVVRVLGNRRQVILYGPPGTGKTYLALKVARSLTNDPGDVRLIQFHPSYSYEDFFEGYRPVKGSDGQVAFELKAGPFRRIVEAARDNPTTPYVLVIDEINRANLAKVFGELYFLLEYRDQSVELLYGDEGSEQFRLPRNVYVIGTMNTADRSIALVDSAMRRRFAFISLHPDEAHVRGVLRNWLVREGLSDEPARLLDALNSRIEDSDFRIGPSYLMRDSVYERDDGLEEVWETSILPLLTEHHIGDSVDVEKRYGLAALRRRLAAEVAVTDVELETIEADSPAPAGEDQDD